ncbi:MAG: stage V sporulation protein AC [Bacillota bacterium]
MPQDKPLNTSRVKLTQKQYQQLVSERQPKMPVLKRALRAFVSGGLICTFGQFLLETYMDVFGMTRDLASSATTATIILIGGLLTGLGYFDKIAAFAGAGVAVPVTGFANSMVSSAMEYKREGLIYGIGSHLFGLAGSVIVYGVVTAFVVGLIVSLVS